MRHNGGMMFASVGITLVMFIILGFFLLVTANLEYMAEDVEGKLEITAYLKDEISQERIAALTQEIALIPGVKSTTFVSNTEALERLGERLGDRKDLLAAYQADNPLRHSFEVYATEGEKVIGLAEGLQKLEGIAEVRYGREEVEKLMSMTQALRIGMLLLVAGLSVATLFVLMNTIRLTVYARRQEIQIMKFVGASDWFIRWPFLLQGMLLGLLGALVAGGVLFLLYSRVNQYVAVQIPFLPLIPMLPYLWLLIRNLALGGIVIGFYGSMLSLGRYLNV
jgi:cell division transport system permease protein